MGSDPANYHCDATCGPHTAGDTAAERNDHRRFKSVPAQKNRSKSRMRDLRHGGSRSLDIAHVRVVRLDEWRRYGDGEGVGRGEVRGLGGRPEVAARHERGNFRARNVLNVRGSAVQGVADLLADVEPDDVESRSRKLDGHGQADVAETNNSDRCCAIVDTSEKLLFHLSVWWGGGRSRPGFRTAAPMNTWKKGTNNIGSRAPSRERRIYSIT